MGKRTLKLGSYLLRARIAGLLCLYAVSLSSCSRKPSEERVKPEDPVLRERIAKNQAFRSGKDSPIPEQDKPKFHGLSYFDVSPQFRFRVKLQRYPNPQTLKLGTNTGEMRTALRYGSFEFEVQGQACRLQVYRTEEDQGGETPHLFVPFRDATTGKTTYAAGRYLDFRENTSGIYDLDFNRAYNPYCAYGTGYSCPLPPSENTLPVPILAGEMNCPPAKER
jgi:uncharacterized protein (DUF1684 family)